MSRSHEKICCNCRHWQMRAGVKRDNPHSHNYSECQRHPPILDEHGALRLPTTAATDRCGEYEFHITEADVKHLTGQREELIDAIETMLTFKPVHSEQKECWDLARLSLNKARRTK